MKTSASVINAIVNNAILLHSKSRIKSFTSCTFCGRLAALHFCNEMYRGQSHGQLSRGHFLWNTVWENWYEKTVTYQAMEAFVVMIKFFVYGVRSIHQHWLPVNSCLIIGLMYSNESPSKVNAHGKRHTWRQQSVSFHPESSPRTPWEDYVHVRRSARWRPRTTAVQGLSKPVSAEPARTRPGDSHVASV